MITDKQLETYRQYVLEQFPREAAAMICGEEIVLCENISEKPLEQFQIDPLVYVKSQPSAIIHSHTYPLGVDRPGGGLYDGRTPSYEDFKTQQRINIPLGIVETEGENVSPPVWLRDHRDDPLVGRKFMFYIHDCYTLIRDWYWQERDVRLGFYPDLDWWNNGEGMVDNAYRDQADRFGFYPVPLDDLQVGDVIFMNTEKTNDHAGIWLGDNQILHHVTTKLSGIWSASRLSSFINMAVRYKG